ncbi:hypothetical protein F5882DRAFT_519247 [Hyaloscypha sp. PMI_1271]|nr:hypothetical protein F5882DRAFT_519247 [Hyaloscypha sp. PMI_1271]
MEESSDGASRRPVSDDFEEGAPKAPQDRGFRFLNFLNFDDTKAKETKNIARSKPQATQPHANTAIPNPALIGPDRFVAGRNNPFQNYPIRMNQRALEIYDHTVRLFSALQSTPSVDPDTVTKGPFCPMFKTMSRIGFYRSITDPAGFLQILSTSVSHMTMLRHQPVAESPEAIALSTQAIESVNKRLGDPVLNMSDGIVAAILTFCCHTTMFNDVPGSKTHMNGLEEIIRRRGGVGTLDSNPAMRMVLFWVDTNYAFMANTVPRFPYPEDLYPAVPQRPGNDPLLLTEACNQEDLLSPIYDLYSLNQLIINEPKVRDIWADGVFAWKYIVPVLHKLLLIKYEQLGPGSAALRTGAMLYIAAIRRRFGVRFLTDIQTQKLRTSIMALLQDADLAGYDAAAAVLLWLFVLVSTLSDLRDDRNWFVSQTAQHISTMGYGS